ncbi:MAG TPA: hypothetical protein VFN26_14520 [Candidatus Acidoferrum sp.]|nr:hypothetical protein [Candidatus Acidoferrum sp.]
MAEVFVMWQEIKTAGPVRSWLAFTAGVLVWLFRYLLYLKVRTGVSVMDKGQLPSEGPAYLWLIPRFWMKVNSLPWILLLFLVFAGLAVGKRRDEKGWTFAFVAGLAFRGTLYQVISRM